MNVIKASFMPVYWAYPNTISIICGYKHPAKILKSFREFCEKRPNYFSPCRPYHTNGEPQYNVYCFMHYYENRKLLDSGTRSLKFKDDLPRIIEAYGLHLLTEEVM